MALTLPVPTATASGTLGSSTWNTYVRDNIGWLGTHKGWKLRRVANQSVATATTATVQWDTEDEDTNGAITVTSGTITIPSGLGGWWAVTARLVWSASWNSTTGPAGCLFTIGGVSYWTAHLPEGSGGTSTVIVPISAASTVLVDAYQKSGGTLNVTGSCFGTWLGPA